jgi:uncharacterized protein (TIGR02147 family)
MGLFSVKDYRSFISEKITENQKIRGYQARLSEAAGVHSSFVSRVMNGHIHLTLDQAADLGEFWGLDQEEADFFIDLVQLERSTSKVLKARLQQKLAAIRKNRDNLNKRFVTAQSLESADCSIYYSAWYFSVIHIILTIPQFRNPRDIAERLQLPQELVLSVLKSLEKIGLAKLVNNQWRTTENNIHTGQQDMWARVQHGHWRQKSAVKIQEIDPQAVHYSGVHTLSKSDAIELRQEVLRFLEKSRKLIAPSPEEKIYFLGCDYYEV